MTHLTKYKNFLVCKSKVLVILALLIPFTACSVITETECRFSDFADIGYYDAKKGKSRKQFEKYQEKCLTYNIDVTEEIVMYDYGRERGLIGYCATTHRSRQCDLIEDAGKVKSTRQINGEMIRLRSLIPPTVAP